MIKSVIDKKTATRYWPFAALAALVFAFYHKIFLVQGAWLVGDHAEQHFPWQWVLADSLKRGVLPFWTDFIHSGFPLIAEGQIGAFYLPNLFFAALFPIEQGYAWNTVAHLMVSILGMAFYLRSVGIDNRGILIGAFVYAFGSTLGGAYYNLTCLKVMTWFPFALMAVDNILSRKSNRLYLSLILGFLFSLQLLAGYLQFAVYAVLFTGIYGLVRFLTGDTRALKDFVFLAFCLAGAVMIAAIFAFPQLFLTAELAFLSNRAQTAEEFAYVGSLSPLSWICLLFPNFEGFFSGKLYLGVLPLFFIIAAFRGTRSKLRTAMILMVAAALLLALGRFSPLYVGIVKTLQFHSFRTPFKFIFFAGFFLSVLCAYGVQEVFARDDREHLRRTTRTFAAFLGFSVLSVLAAYFIFHIFQQPLLELGEQILAKWVHGKPGHPFAWEHYEARLANYIRYGQSVLDPRSPTVLIPIAKMGAVLLWLIALFRFHRFRKSLYGLAIALLVSDLQLSYSDIQGDYASYRNFFRKNAFTEYLENGLANQQYFNYSDNPSESPLPQAKNMIYGLRAANAYSPLVVKDYYDYMGNFGGVNDSIAYRRVDEAHLKANLPLLQLLGIRFLVTDCEFEDKRTRLILKEGDWRLLKVAVPGRFRLVQKVKVIPNRQDLLTALRTPGTDLHATVFLEEEPGVSIAADDEGTNSLSLNQESEGFMEFDVVASAPSILALGQTFYPGWEAFLNDKPIKIFRANYAFQAVVVPAGTHRITLRYNPWHRLNKSFPFRRDSLK